MIQSGFCEGIEYRSMVSPLLLRLPDDNGNALLEICKVVHHHGNWHLGTKTFDILINIGVLSDKYDMGRALHP